MTILRSLTSARNYANLSLPKEAKFKRCRTIKTNERKPCAAEKRQPVPKRVSGDGSAPPRFLVAVNFASQAACHGNPPVLLRYVSSSQKIFALQIFSGSPVLPGFPCCSCCLFRGVCLAAARRSRAALVYAKHTPWCQTVKISEFIIVLPIIFLDRISSI